MQSSIIDNREANTLLNSLKIIGNGGRELCIATAFFSLDGLLLLAETLPAYEKIRILFGDDAEAKQRVRLLQMLRQRSDEDLLIQREAQPYLSPLQNIEALFQARKIEARCYTAKKFHAKAYLFQRDVYPNQAGVLGSGNFTRAGLTQNIELNVVLTVEQNQHLMQWFEDRWNEAQADDVTADVLAEIRRQIDLYAPYILYLKALYAWGVQQQDESASVGGLLAGRLDPHQEIGFRQAVRILERENGVLVCDGVGLGKSFIALALIERYCRLGKRVLLIAPKAILVSSWEGYLETYLSRYREPFGSILEQPMTAFGFDFDEDVIEAGGGSERDRANADLLTKLAERADVIVIDESHNFRTTSSSRYKNLFRIVAPSVASGRKKVVMLTATPINTQYRDLSAQTALITHDEGGIGGYSIAAIRRAAQQLDLDARNTKDLAFTGGQMSLELLETNDQTLRSVLERIVIQRSRKTCRELAAAAGKDLRFPVRRAPETVDYCFDGASADYRDAIFVAEKRFRPGVLLYQAQKKAEEEANSKGKKYDPQRLAAKYPTGVKFTAFQPDQFKLKPDERSLKNAQLELRLTGLVYTNTLKQLESSPVAFQGILQSIALGLIARLEVVLGEKAAPLIAPHREWVRTPLFPRATVNTEGAEVGDSEAVDMMADDGDILDASGGETEDWLAKAVQERGLQKKLADFTEKTHDVARWSTDIVADLGYLKEIHAATLKARQSEDPKLVRVAKTLRAEIDQGHRVLVFTQSRRTADYLERELKARFPGVGIARIDSGNIDIRPAVLHAFSPGYNPATLGKWPPSVPRRVDILISTDVLAEGVNLQEAQAILNYDIHWNPVRLIQRIGRVDRRLNPLVTPDVHEFSIYNVLPPDDIEKIIDLVGRIEGRTLMISNTLGLDASFFKSSDKAGNLKEFNARYEGDLTAADRALADYVRFTQLEKPDAHTQAQMDAVPPGAFGVWAGAPQDGVFALFVMEAKRTATDADREKFASVIGRPVLALVDASGGKPRFDAGEILALLSKTVPGQASGVPSDEATLSATLKKVRNAVRQNFADISLPATITPRLVCWMELRKSGG